MIPWVAGNTLNLAVPLQTKTIVSGQEVTAPYTPPAGSTLNVWLVNGRQRRKYDYTLTDNVVHFTDNGTLSPATYAVEIQVIEPSTRHLRTFKLQLAVAAALPVPATTATTPAGSPAGSSPAGSPSPRARSCSMLPSSSRVRRATRATRATQALMPTSLPRISNGHSTARRCSLSPPNNSTRFLTKKHL